MYITSYDLKQTCLIRVEKLTVIGNVLMTAHEDGEQP